ncbi:hypothetical protein [Altererythrobacter sp. Root672]|uniref:hypothetical protein n=1 Tax=Altererythrobacter sp. Root672 TaxID=1736584 RepID=UPI001F3A1923|nr:hypothetical protein [Altererythrobacter sp. Root672]
MGWIMLLVVLISAVPTMGQARTRVIGSAFDPATYSVVVSPKKPRVTGDKTSMDRKTPLDHLFDGVPLSSAAEPVLILPAFALATQVRYQPLPSQTVGRPALTRAHGPRAPPAL